MEEGKKWYANTYFLVLAPITVFALGTAALVLLVLPRSGEAIRLMQVRMTDAKSVFIESEFQYEGTYSPRSGSVVAPKSRERVTLSTKGWFDRYGGDPGILDQVFTARIGAAEKPDEVSGEFVQEGAQMYANLNLLPAKLGDISLANVPTRVWLRFTPNTLAKRLNRPEMGGEGKELTAQDRAYLKEQFRATPFLRVVQKLKDEKVRGVPTLHFQVAPEKLFIKDFVFIEETVRHQGIMPAGQEAALRKFFDNVTPTDDGEVWIGRKDYYLHRARFRFRYDSPERSGILTVTIDFSRFNERTGIAAPKGTNFRELDTYLAEMFPTGQGGGGGLLGGPASGTGTTLPGGGGATGGVDVSGGGTVTTDGGTSPGGSGGGPQGGDVTTGGAGSGGPGTGTGGGGAPPPTVGGGGGEGVQEEEPAAPRKPPTLPQIFAALIREILKLLGLVMVLMFMYAGAVAMLSKGDPEKMRHAKKVIISAIIGTIIIFGANALVSYLANTILNS